MPDKKEAVIVKASCWINHSMNQWSSQPASQPAGQPASQPASQFFFFFLPTKKKKRRPFFFFFFGAWLCTPTASWPASWPTRQLSYQLVRHQAGWRVSCRSGQLPDWPAVWPVNRMTAVQLASPLPGRPASWPKTYRNISRNILKTYLNLYKPIENYIEIY